MRHEPNVKIEKYRIDGPADTNTGGFRFVRPGAILVAISSEGFGWDHISVSTANRTPTYEEMEFIRGLFFRDDECVMQLHVPRSDHVNCHPYTLHLWRPQTGEEMADLRRRWQAAGEPCPWEDVPPGPIPRPPAWMVGPSAEVKSGKSS